MPDRPRPPRDHLEVIFAAVEETARMARETQSRVTQHIANSERAIQEARDAMDRANESLRRLSP